MRTAECGLKKKNVLLFQSAFRIQIMMMPRILIADDQPDVLEALRLLLKSEEYEIQAVNSPAEVLRALEARDYGHRPHDRLSWCRDLRVRGVSPGVFARRLEHQLVHA